MVNSKTKPTNEVSLAEDVNQAICEIFIKLSEINGIADLLSNTQDATALDKHTPSNVGSNIQRMAQECMEAVDQIEQAEAERIYGSEEVRNDYK